MAKFLTNLPSEGTVMGQTVSDKIGFYGTTAPAVQLSGLTLVTNATPRITAFGFTSAQAGDILTAVRFMYSVMASVNLAR
jgi:hypothetical protein